MQESARSGNRLTDSERQVPQGRIGQGGKLSALDSVAKEILGIPPIYSYKYRIKNNVLSRWRSKSWDLFVLGNEMCSGRGVPNDRRIFCPRYSMRIEATRSWASSGKTVRAMIPIQNLKSTHTYALRISDPMIG